MQLHDLRRLILVAAILVSGCYYTPRTGWIMAQEEPLDTIIDNTEFCYSTWHGIVAERHGDGECPAQDDVEYYVQRLLTRDNRDPLELVGVTVVFSTTRPEPNERYDVRTGLRNMSYGAMRLRDEVIVVHHYNWQITIQHESLHALLLHDGDPDKDHLDYRWVSYGLNRMPERIPVYNE